MNYPRSKHWAQTICFNRLRATAPSPDSLSLAPPPSTINTYMSAPWNGHWRGSTGHKTRTGPISSGVWCGSLLRARPHILLSLPPHCSRTGLCWTLQWLIVRMLQHDWLKLANGWWCNFMWHVVLHQSCIVNSWIFILKMMNKCVRCFEGSFFFGIYRTQ